MSQVGKNLGLLGGATVAALGLGLYAYFGVMKGDEKEAKAKEIAEQVFPAAAAQGPSAPSAFKTLTVVADGQTTKLEHTAKGWRITSPVDAPADGSVVEAVVSALTHDSYKQLVDEHPSKEDLARYGLDAPKFQVSAELKKPNGQTESVALSGGIENPFDGSVYVRRDGEDPVHAIAGTFKAAVEKSTFELREKRLVTFEESALKSIDLAGKGVAVSLALDDAKHWRLTSPIQERADDSAVNTLWTALLTHRAKAFPADTADARKDFGLATPVLKATFTPNDAPATVIAFGEKGTGADRHAFAEVTEGSHTTIAEVPPALIDALAQKPDALRDHTVLAFDEQQVRRIDYQAKAGEPVISLTREKNQDGSLSDWTLVAPKPEKAKGWKVSSMLYALKSLKAAGFGPENLNDREWARHGITAKARTITLTGESGQVLAKLVIGDEVKGSKGHVWVRGSRAQPLDVEWASLEQLPKSVDELADAPASAPAAKPVAAQASASKP